MHPGPWTFYELTRAAEERERVDWARHAELLAMIHNQSASRPRHPDEFNPFLAPPPAKKAKPLDPRASLDLLVAAVVK